MVIRRCLKLGVSRGSKGKVSRWGSQREREKEEEFPKSLFFNSQEDIAHINGLHYLNSSSKGTISTSIKWASRQRCFCFSLLYIITEKKESQKQMKEEADSYREVRDRYPGDSKKLFF